MTAPHHVAFIMDGNGRWAQARGLTRSAGHKAGFEHLPDVLEVCYSLGIEVVSAYAWSTENWQRPEPEVAYIVRSVEEQLPRFVKELHKRAVRFVWSGSRERLSARALRALDDGVALTEAHRPYTLNLAFNYGGQQELAEAVCALVAEGIAADAVSEAAVERHLWTQGLPDVDLVVRTGGDMRLSNFLR